MDYIGGRAHGPNMVDFDFGNSVKIDHAEIQ